MTLRTFFGFLVVASVFGISANKTTDPDLFWHLRTGDYILANGIPSRDPGFSFTAQGWDWVTHEWLTQVLMVTLYNHLGGTVALVCVFAAVVTLAFWLVMWSSDGKPYLAGVVVVTACLASSPLIQARPQMFNMLFTAWIICVAERIGRGQWSVRWIWTFAPLILLWVNMHAGFVLGFAVLGVYITGGYLGLRWPGESGESGPGLSRMQLKTFVAAGGVGLGASLLNPNTFGMWAYTYDTLTSRAMRDIITEWQSPNFHQPKFWPFALLLVGVLLAMAASRRRPTPTDVLFTVGTTLAALQSARNIPIFALVMVPILTRHVLSAIEERRTYAVLSGTAVEPEPSSLAKLGIGVVVCIFSALVALNLVAQAHATPQAITERFPVRAIDWIEAEGLADQRLFHEYSWGGYLIWRDVPVYIDGRADVYGDDFLYEFDDASRAMGEWRTVFADNDIELVMVRPDAILNSVLSEANEWRVAYRDDVAVVFETTPSG